MKKVPYAGQETDPMERMQRKRWERRKTLRDRVLEVLDGVPLRRKALLLESLAWETREEFNTKEMYRVAR